MRRCFREPIPEITQAADYLNAAVDAHNLGEDVTAAKCIKMADIEIIREWTESIWGKGSPYVQYQPVAEGISAIFDAGRVKVRMPNTNEKRLIHARDGYHCRFCDIPVIRKEIRIKIMRFYPEVLSWGRTNTSQHAAFQAMWAQYDHLLPHSKGGTNDIENVVLTCAPCNFGRMSYTLEEVGLLDPRTQPILVSAWDGLERFK